MTKLFTTPQAVRVDSTGTPYANAEANFYLTGTTTRTNSYANNALTVAHDNPVLANSAGQWPPIYLDPNITYRCIITSAGSQLDDVDPIAAPDPASGVAVTDSAGHFAGTEVETVLADIGANYTKNASTETISALWTFSAGIAMGDTVLDRPEIKDFGITHNAITSASNAITADCSTGNSFYHLLTENTTFTLSNPAPTGKLTQIVIRIKQDGSGGAYTVAWPAAVTWGGGTAPVVSTGNDAIDKFTLTTDDAGTLWFGEFAQAYGAA